MTGTHGDAAVCMPSCPVPSDGGHWVVVHDDMESNRAGRRARDPVCYGYGRRVEKRRPSYASLRGEGPEDRAIRLHAFAVIEWHRDNGTLGVLARRVTYDVFLSIDGKPLEYVCSVFSALDDAENYCTALDWVGFLICVSMQHSAARNRNWTRLRIPQRVPVTIVVGFVDLPAFLWSFLALLAAVLAMMEAAALSLLRLASPPATVTPVPLLLSTCAIVQPRAPQPRPSVAK